MKILAGQTVLLTGASGGLGRFMVEAFAARGLKLALVAYPGAEVEEMCRELRGRGLQAIGLPLDLRDAARRREVVQVVRKEFGPIDILVNNAGVEFTAPYDSLTEAQILEVLSVNLEAPMILSRLVLPEMLERGRGHIVNISSLAAKSGPAFQEPYAATKAALIGLTASLRATYSGTGVGASVIVPGFVEAGIYARLKAESGCVAPALLAGCTGKQVARAVMRAIERDEFEVIVNRYPVRPMLALAVLCPRLGSWVTRRIGVHDFFRRVAEQQRKGRR